LTIFALFQRINKLSLKKKLAVFCLIALLGVIVAAAFYRQAFVLVPALIAFAAGIAYGALRLDRSLKTARRAALRLRASTPAATAPAAVPAGMGPAHWWATKSKISPNRLVQRLTKMRSLDGRDVLALNITSGQWTWRQVELALEMYRYGGPARKKVLKVLDTVTKTRLLLLADTCYRQNLRNDDILNAATIYKYVYGKLGAGHFKGKRRGEFFLDALSQTGRGDQTLKFQSLYDVENMNPNDLHLYRANATNPVRHASQSGVEWLAEINAMYEGAGLATIRLADGEGPSFLRLHTDPVSEITEGPLVSIIMPVYRPDAFTDLAIESAINQSYHNIEIIVVDDGSGEEYTDRLAKWQQADPRVKVVLNKPNSGAYTSRNIGYSMAQGEFLTIFDGDDWQHPQKIQLLVDAAQKQTDSRLVSAPWSRVDEDLMFHYRGWRGAYVTPAHVSAMFPVAVIRQRLGFWDTVRKAADTEFILRYQLLVNAEEALEVSDVPLTLSLVGSTNLSMDDFRLGYRSPDRVAYRDSYEHWHKRIRADRHSGYLDFKSETRAFPAPAQFLPNRGEPLELDALFVGDFGAPTERSAAMWRDIEEARDAGLRIGLMHMPSILHTVSFDSAFNDEIMDAFAEERLVRVELTDQVHSSKVYVYDPTSFQFRRELRSGQVADMVLVRAFEPPYDFRTGSHKYDVTTVSHNLAEMFGERIQWVPEDPAIASFLGKALGGPSDVAMDAEDAGDAEALVGAVQ
jgi:glycosyltransferase involved in cell wall biosynthesis